MRQDDDQLWLVAGHLLITPFAPRPDGLIACESEAIAQIGRWLERDRRAGLLPSSGAFWFSPHDGCCTPLTPARAWQRVRRPDQVVVDLYLVQAMRRVVPVTLLIERSGSIISSVCRAPVSLISVAS